MDRGRLVRIIYGECNGILQTQGETVGGLYVNIIAGDMIMANSKMSFGGRAEVAEDKNGVVSIPIGYLLSSVPVSVIGGFGPNPVVRYYSKDGRFLKECIYDI